MIWEFFFFSSISNKILVTSWIFFMVGCKIRWVWLPKSFQEKTNLNSNLRKARGTLRLKIMFTQFTQWTLAGNTTASVRSVAALTRCQMSHTAALDKLTKKKRRRRIENCVFTIFFSLSTGKCLLRLISNFVGRLALILTHNTPAVHRMHILMSVFQPTIALIYHGIFACYIVK